MGCEGPHGEFTFRETNWFGFVAELTHQRWQIHPDKRHLDKVAAKEFWRYLFAFIKLKLQ
jgi:hypothetical protein